MSPAERRCFRTNCDRLPPHRRRLTGQIRLVQSSAVSLIWPIRSKRKHFHKPLSLTRAILAQNRVALYFCRNFLYIFNMKLKYILQIGLALVLIYAGVSALLYPSDWIGFVPAWVQNFGLSVPAFLHLHSIAELILGLWLLSNIKLRIAAFFAFLDLLAIIVFSGFSRAALSITFRDFGLLAIALYLILDK